MKDWVHAVGGVPGVRDDDMPRQNAQRKHGTTRGSPRRSRTAKASRRNRPAAKSRCACEWGGWGQVSEDGPGQKNPDRSEDPWGRAEDRSHGGVSTRPSAPTQSGNKTGAKGNTKGRSKPRRATGMPGAGLTGARRGKALPERPALKPYWGKPAVRNFRGDDGDVGIIRSPVRAIVLPDSARGG
jgi:hypothetical protein